MHALEQGAMLVAMALMRKHHQLRAQKGGQLVPPLKNSTRCLHQRAISATTLHAPTAPSAGMVAAA